MAGSGAYQGAVLSIDRLGEHLSFSPPIQYVTNQPGAWHLVQTNSDLLSPDLDGRRSVANMVLSKTNQTVGDENALMQFMHTPLLLNPGTVFSTVMVPATGYISTALPGEAPGSLDLVASVTGGIQPS